MAFDPQVAISADPTIWIQWQTSSPQPSGPLASSAEQAWSAVVVVVVGDGDICLSQQLLDGRIQLSPPLLQLKRPLRPASSQRQDDFQARSSRSDHPKWLGIAWVFAFEKGQRGFQGLGWVSL